MNIRDFFNSLTPEQIEEGNRKQLEENQQVYNKFKTAYDKGYCSLCGKELNSFAPKHPCFHWFLKPEGIRKKYFKEYLSTQIGFFHFDSYIRWIANLEAPFKNINDLTDEMNPAKVLEYTVKYKNIEWSINIGQTDFEGHPDSKNANFPHFHIQMRIDNNIFIRFNDFHIPLTEEDIFTFKALQEAPDKIVWNNSFGGGMSILENQEILEQLDELMQPMDDFDNATFNTETLIQMPEGETISGEALEQIFKESKAKSTPVRHLIKKHYPRASISTEIQPGAGVPEILKRNKRK